MTVMAATAWPTNAHLIEACAELGYLKKDDLILDPTYGRGIWWKRWQPGRLVWRVHDESWDFRKTGFPDNSFDAIAYDPPYVCVGGRSTTGIPDMHDRYGLTDAPRTPLDLQRLIEQGMGEMHRVLKPGGIMLVKCQDYVSSGKLFPGTHWTATYALRILGMEMVDRLEHITSPRPQPPGRRQVHARRNLSTLFVFRKARR